MKGLSEAYPRKSQHFLSTSGVETSGKRGFLGVILMVLVVKEFDQKYKEQLTKILEGNGSITKTILQDRLRLLGKPVSGNKSVLAERLLVALVNNGETAPNDLPLAADYITDEQELDGVVDEEDSDDEDVVDDGKGASIAIRHGRSKDKNVLTVMGYGSKKLFFSIGGITYGHSSA